MGRWLAGGPNPGGPAGHPPGPTCASRGGMPYEGDGWEKGELGCPGMKGMYPGPPTTRG